MYRLYYITLNTDGSEKQSVYEYEDVIQAEGNFEQKKGQAMSDKKFAFLMLLDNIGQIHDGYIAKVGDGTITPRLIEVMTKDSEVSKIYTYESSEDVSADYYKRLGGAKLDNTVKSEMLRGIDENGNSIEYAYWVRIPAPTVTPTE